MNNHLMVCVSFNAQNVPHVTWKLNVRELFDLYSKANKEITLVGNVKTFEKYYYEPSDTIFDFKLQYYIKVKTKKVKIKLVKLAGAHIESARGYEVDV